MPKQKDLKRLARARMQKTGESYTTARSHLLAKRRGVVPAARGAASATRAVAAASATRTVAAASTAGHAGRPLPTNEEIVALAGMSDDAVRAKTGKAWREWIVVLDAAGAVELAHRAIAMLLHERHGLPEWWAQTVTVTYERVRGLRDVGQRRGGGYEANKSKTYPVALARLYAACGTARARGRWLGATKLTETKATAQKSLRLRGADGTPVELRFAARGAGKSQLTVQHRKLASRADAARMKRFWGERLDALTTIVAQQSPRNAVRARAKTRARR